jgi:hypothetical protein
MDPCADTFQRSSEEERRKPSPLGQAQASASDCSDPKQSLTACGELTQKKPLEQTILVRQTELVSSQVSLFRLNLLLRLQFVASCPVRKTLEPLAGT